LGIFDCRHRTSIRVFSRRNLLIIEIYLALISFLRQGRSKLPPGSWLNLLTYNHLIVSKFSLTPTTPNPRPANAAALLKQELAATSSGGAFDADSSGSNALFAYQTP